MDAASGMRGEHWGGPVLLFPTAGGDVEEIERMQVIGALWPLIEAGRIKVHSRGTAWPGGHGSRGSTPRAIARSLQNRFDGFVEQEVVPAIRPIAAPRTSRSQGRGRFHRRLHRCGITVPPSPTRSKQRLR